MIEFLLGGLIVAGAIAIGVVLGNIIFNKFCNNSNNSNSYTSYVPSSSYTNTYPILNVGPSTQLRTNPNLVSVSNPIQKSQQLSQSQQDDDRALLY